VLGERHPDTLTSILAMIYHQCEQLEEAEALREEVLKIHRQVFGECHRNTSTSMSNLATMYHQHKQLVSGNITKPFIKGSIGLLNMLV